jgi:diguanylate cyclase (GGDEF)-like protein
VISTTCISSVDRLTNLLNSASLASATEQLLAEHPQLDWISTDIAGFAAYNGERGHPAGDRLLRALAESLKAARPSDVIARVGGDSSLLVGPPDPQRLPMVQDWERSAPVRLHLAAGRITSDAEMDAVIAQLGANH